MTGMRKSGIAIGAAAALFSCVTVADCAPLFSHLPPRGRQMALDEAMALAFMRDHIRNADGIAARISGEITNSTTGQYGAVTAHVPGSAASNLAADSRDFQSEATTAFVEIGLLEGGIENRFSDADYDQRKRMADSAFALEQGADGAHYRARLQNLLDTLHDAAKIAEAGFRAKWGIGSQEALPS